MLASATSEDDRFPDVVTRLAGLLLASVKLDPVLIGRTRQLPNSPASGEATMAGQPPADPAVLAAA